MGTNLKKPRQRIVYPQGAIPDAGAFSDPVRFSTLTAKRAMLLIEYTQDSIGVDLLMRVSYVGDDGALYPMTLEDGTVTGSASGYETTVRVAIKRFERGTVGQNFSYGLDVEACKEIVLEFAEDGPDATDGTLQVSVQLSEY